jgi:hypothetical protein
MSVLIWCLLYRYSRAPVSAHSVSTVWVICGLPWPAKIGKLKKLMVHRFQNARQARTGCNMVKSSSPIVPSTWPTFLCPHTHPKMSESVTFLLTRARGGGKTTLPMDNVVYSTISYYFNIGNVLLCISYQLNFTVFMYVTWIPHYIQRSVLSAVSCNCGGSWNVSPVDTGVLLYTKQCCNSQTTATVIQQPSLW